MSERERCKACDLSKPTPEERATTKPGEGTDLCWSSDWLCNNARVDWRARVAELTAERDALKVTSDAAMEEQGAYVDELRAEIGKLRRERINDRHELGKYIRERDEALRKLAAAEEEARVARDALEELRVFVLSRGRSIDDNLGAVLTIVNDAMIVMRNLPGAAPQKGGTP